MHLKNHHLMDKSAIYEAPRGVDISRGYIVIVCLNLIIIFHLLRAVCGCSPAARCLEWYVWSVASALYCCCCCCLRNPPQQRHRCSAAWRQSVSAASSISWLRNTRSRCHFLDCTWQLRITYSAARTDGTGWLRACRLTSIRVFELRISFSSYIG